MKFDPVVLVNDRDRRTTILAILSAVLEAVDPERAVRRALIRDGSHLRAGDSLIDLDSTEHVTVIALGKAAPAMSRAAWSVLEGVDRRLLVISDHEEEVPEEASFVIGGHPLPTERSVVGARTALALAGQAGPNDLFLCLISGGGSALGELPAPGLTLDAVRQTSCLLLAHAVPIEAVNVVRRHLSAFKGGRLAEAAAPARVVTLLLSDVAGNPLPSIASGPTVADPSSFADAVGVLDRYRLLDRVPQAVRSHLEAGVAGLVAETPKALREDATVVADIDTAMAAARTAARSAGFETRIAPTPLTGEAAQTAIRCIETAVPGVVIFGGETTVTVRGTGVGGRNQEGALAAAIAIEGKSDLVFATLATDGVDGPTDAAGAIVDGASVERGRSLGLDPQDHLTSNDSHRFLDATGDLLVSGPTGTNVGDVWLTLRTGPGDG